MIICMPLILDVAWGKQNTFQRISSFELKITLMSRLCEAVPFVNLFRANSFVMNDLFVYVCACLHVCVCVCVCEGSS